MFPQWYTFFCWVALCFTSDAQVIHHLNTHAEFLSMIGSAGQRPVVIKFSTPHCPACVVMQSVFQRVAQEYYGQVIFGDVNMLYNQQSHLNFNIQSIPAFTFFINGALHNQGTITDESTLRMWTSSLAALAPQQHQQQQQQQQLMQQQQHPQQLQQPQQQPQIHAQQQPPHGAPASLRIAGACDSLLNDVFVFKGYTASNSAYYGSASNRHLYHDLDCNGRGSSPRWILDDFNGPIASKVADLDNDNDCRYRARLDWANGSLPLGTHRWRVYCTSAWVSTALTIEDADPLATTTTTTTTAASACDIGRRSRDHIENVVVIGAGPAGMAAALYAARAGLCPTVVAPPHGGQLLSKGVDVQNYPGVFEETGLSMITTMREQAERFDARRVNELVMEANTSRSPFTIKTADTLLQTRTIILATGADSKWLGVQGEYEFRGHGVSSCAACDGFLFKGKSCAVIGGGETAIEEALMLARTCSSVTMIHRRDKFRARQVLQMSALKNPNIRVVWNTVVEKFVGTDEGNNQK
jgi:thiol-disulfide isomerase/thioredoxin/NADH dehydrogenase FAD-containing subunit